MKIKTSMQISEVSFSSGGQRSRVCSGRIAACSCRPRRQQHRRMGRRFGWEARSTTPQRDFGSTGPCQHSLRGSICCHRNAAAAGDGLLPAPRQPSSWREPSLAVPFRRTSSGLSREKPLSKVSHLPPQGSCRGRWEGRHWPSHTGAGAWPPGCSPALAFAVGSR